MFVLLSYVMLMVAKKTNKKTVCTRTPYSEANRIIPLGFRLRELGNNRKIQIVPAQKSVRGRLRECVNAEFI